MISVPARRRGSLRYEFAVSRRSFGSHHRIDRDGGCNRLRADRSVRKARQAGELPATRAGASAGSSGASPARAGDSGSSELGGIALAECPGIPILYSTATLTLQSSGAGTTMNSLAAPDVRAPSVRGRWHFQSIFKQGTPRTRSGGGYRFARAGQMPGRFRPRFHRPVTSFPKLALACQPAADIRWRS
jgi:hypothetical protein